ncbi:hypothetical protein [Dyadobacter fermentans]|uniref:DoxX family protein n=1 Tax=Dyadobacter fermentans (strain ATCC 700827 / DSM 18053 / CIP 107007 / KCTC 52180 / NS114) TaxID=471854 RepID=C6VSN7_DYAFD|nr:hypothetical protein [Dyadobacter fermentans]ACT92859.1 conserved hypothetical protein [Dyadobacter fermentans DSM 18053]
MSTIRTTEEDLTLTGTEEAIAADTAGQPAGRSWPEWQKVLFRIAFVFFLAMSIPNSPTWYTDLVTFDWTRLHYRDVYDIARFGSGLDLFGRTIFGSTLEGYATWIITLLASIAVGAIWTVIVKVVKREPKDYNLLYYWLRVVVRYRAGIGIIGFGYTKLMPTQMPYPSYGLLNTNFGDFTLQKIYWLSVGIVPWYQVFAGVVELTAGILLFFRGTTTLGAILLLGALGDIVYVNFAYDGGVHVYSSYFVLLAAFLLIKDIPKFWNLLILERFTVPNSYYPAFSQKWQQYVRYGLKIFVFGLFVFYLFWLQYVNFKYDPYKQPSTAGIKELRGNYQVTEFKINNQEIPYSPTDTVRWQWATFENWTSLTFKVNKPTPLDLSNGGGAPMRDLGRTFELTGTGGGQRVFHYLADTVAHTLYLQDKYARGGPRDGIGQLQQREARQGQGGVGGGARGDANRARGEGANDDQANADARNRGERTNGRGGPSDRNWISKAALVNIGDENKMIDPLGQSARRDREFAAKPRRDKRNHMILNYSTTDGSRVILKGINEKKDSIYVVLDRVERPYVLAKSTLNAGKYD